MKNTKINLSGVTCFLVIILIAGCTITSTKPKILEFNAGVTAVDSIFKTIIDFQSASINGFEKRINDDLVTEIEIKIINGVNLPAEKSDLQKLAKKIASRVKDEVTNQKEFASYRVFFVRQSDISSASMSKWKSWVFGSEEL